MQNPAFLGKKYPIYYVHFGEFRGFPESLWRHNYPEFKFFKILTSPSYFLPQIPCPYQFLCKTHHFLTSNSQLCAFWGILGVFPYDYDVLTLQNLNFIKFWRHHRISHPQNLGHTNYHAKPSISRQNLLCAFWGILGVSRIIMTL